MSNTLQEAKEWWMTLLPSKRTDFVYKYHRHQKLLSDDQILHIYLSEHPQERKITIDEAVQWLFEKNAIEKDNDDLTTLTAVLIIASKGMRLPSGDCSHYFINDNGFWQAEYETDRPTIKLSQIESTQTNTVEREEESENSKKFWKDHSECFPLESIRGEDVEEAAERYVGHSRKLYDGDDHAKHDAFVSGFEVGRQQSESRIKELEEALKEIQQYSNAGKTITSVNSHIANMVDKALSKNK